MRANNQANNQYNTSAGNKNKTSKNTNNKNVNNKNTRQNKNEEMLLKEQTKDSSKNFKDAQVSRENKEPKDMISNLVCKLSLDKIKEAIVLSEIIGKPVAKRKRYK